VTLATGKAPRSNEVVFFELAMGKASSAWYIDYPWLWPSIKPAQISGQYDANTKTVLLVGNPFGTVQDFSWSVSVFDANDHSVYDSGGILGNVRQTVIPDNVIDTTDPNATYTYQLTAQSLDKVPGIPAFVIQSVKNPMK
jgi:hypothetical protein